jgi:hypothetical protein
MEVGRKDHTVATAGEVDSCDTIHGFAGQGRHLGKLIWNNIRMVRKMAKTVKDQTTAKNSDLMYLHLDTEGITGDLEDTASCTTGFGSE